MPSTTAETYTLDALRKDAQRIAELTEKARVAINDAATIADRIVNEGHNVDARFTFMHAITEAAGGIKSDIVEDDATPQKLVEYSRDLVALVELAAREEAKVDA